LRGFTIYPAIDLRQGAVVRLKQGDPERETRFSDDPAATARAWFDAGATWLHVVNLDSAFGDADTLNRKAIKAILAQAQQCQGSIQLGGGIRSYADIKAAFDSGVQRIILGTLAVEQSEILFQAIQEYGPDRIAAGLDAEKGWVKVRGWQQATRQNAIELAEALVKGGLKWLVFTDIARDGIGTGLNIESTRRLTRLPGLLVIASGGVIAAQDIQLARQAGCAGVIVGRALYDRQFTITQWEYP